MPWIKGRIIKETYAAMLFIVEESEDENDWKQEWFPHSQITQIKRQPLDSTGQDEINVSEWMLKKKGISQA